MMKRDERCIVVLVCSSMSEVSGVVVVVKVCVLLGR